jgi:hypothetical protein
MPFEAGRVHVELGRHAPPGALRDRHLARAAAIFDGLECAAEAERTRMLLADRRSGR